MVVGGRWVVGGGRQAVGARRWAPGGKVAGTDRQPDQALQQRQLTIMLFCISSMF